MLTTSPPADAEARLRRVRDHIAELRHAGRDEDAEAVGFVRELAERALAEHRSAPPRGLLTTGETALALGLSDQTIRNWVAAGRLPAVRRGVRTMVPREAVQEEIERSRVRPSVEPAGTAPEEAARSAWRRELLAALPRAVVGPLNALHDQLEDGQELSPAEKAEMVRLERAMADAAARYLEVIIRRGRAGAA